MSHPRRLTMPSSRSHTSLFTRPKSLVVQVLTRNGKEAEQAAAAAGGGLGSTSGSNSVTSVEGSSSVGSISGFSVSSAASPSSSASPSPTPSPSPSPSRSPASGAPQPGQTSGGHMPSPPKTPPGLRINVPSPGPVGGAPAPPPNYSVLPALERTHRFVITGTLQQSLFGVVKLAFDRLTKRQVAIKISRRDLSSASQARSGVTVLENVKREALVLKYMGEHKSLARCQAGGRKRLGECGQTLPKVPVPEVPDVSDGLSQMDLSDAPSASSASSSNSSATSAGSATSGGSSPTNNLRGESNTDIPAADVVGIKSDNQDNEAEMEPVSVGGSDAEQHGAVDVVAGIPSAVPSADPLASPQLPDPHTTICPGASYVCDLIDEFEDEYFHYLITEFVPGGDLYSILTTFPNHRLSESQARYVFRQIVMGVKHLHDNHIAHLDLSLENVCLDASENIRIIDFGVAALHPLAPSSSSSSSFALSSSSPVSTIPFSHQKPPEPGQSVLDTFMCKPIAHLYNKPGKIRYMSPELFGNAAWDAYKNDLFSLGVILYSLLTGRPPFQHADPSDIWFQVIYSGQWLTPNIRSQPTAHVFTHLSEPALNCIDRLIKPQTHRMSCDEILAHPWMNQQ